MKMTDAPIKAISLFSGAGGMDLGFLRAGFDIVAAYDNQPTMVDTYNRNLGGAHVLDLATCDFQQLSLELSDVIGTPDIIIGGPPCQGFTSAGSRFGMIRGTSSLETMPMLYAFFGRDGS